MNRLKKYASLLLALVMALALAVPAMAGENETTDLREGSLGSITINNATNDRTYQAYQIFKGDLSYSGLDGEGDAQNPVLSNVKWGDNVDTALLSGLASVPGLENIDLSDAAKVAEALNDSNAEAFAQAIKSALTGVPKGSEVAADAICTIADVPVGYYLIKDSEDKAVGEDSSITLFMLQVVGPTVANSKSGTPTPDKKIVEGENKVNTGDYDIGETITFELTAQLPNNFENYETYKLIFHDTMSAGLTFDAVTEIKMGETSLTAEQIAAVAKNEGQNLTVTFDGVKTYFPTATNGSVITVTYTAHLNENAVVGNPGNTNDMYLEFSNNPNDEGKGETGETPPKEVIVFTYKLDADKVDGKDSSIKLEGAEFVLKNAKGDGEGVQYAVINAATGKFIRWDDRIEGTNDAGETTTLVSDAQGNFKVIGIDAGTYWLEETKAPVGYNLPNPAETEIKIEATIKDNGGVAGIEDALESLTIQVNGATRPDPENPDGNPVPDTTPGVNGVVSTTIENNKGATLPETGGIGTTIFYALGGLLTVGAVVLLVTKKRMSADEK